MTGFLVAVKQEEWAVSRTERGIEVQEVFDLLGWPFLMRYCRVWMPAEANTGTKYGVQRQALSLGEPLQARYTGSSKKKTPRYISDVPE
jgi:hypothetical protein